MNYNNIEILDCTLRDGGYYTNWWFGDQFVKNYLITVSRLPINIVELGYLSNNKDDAGLYYHLNKKTLIQSKKLLRKNQKIYVMINLKEFKTINDLKKILKENSNYIDGVRFAVSAFEIDKYKKFIDMACNEFKKLEINVNIMYFSKWFDKEKTIKKINKLINTKIRILSLVDSYGALQPKDILDSKKYFRILNFKLGCHFHNNCGLAIANTLTAINNGCTVVDSTFTGMGRGAGNAATEILIAVLKKINNKISRFQINKLLENFLNLKSKLGWGES